jgi:putative tricarboxylic transport membrane protein
VLGGGLAMLITYLSLLGINFFYGYFNHLIQSMIMLLVIGLLAVTGNNKWFVNVALIVFGAFLSFIGFNYILNTNFLTFGNAYLEQGLPPITLMICLFAIPVIVNAFAERAHKQTNQDKAPIKWPLIYRALPTMLRSSGLGWLLGLIPGMSYAYSSTASYSTEHWFEKNKTSEQAIANRVVAAETANNAGVISCLIPFLIFGIPIISSEIIVINLLDQNTVLNFAWVLNNINAILLTMAVASVIGLLSAWPMSRIVVKLIDFDNRWLQMLLLLLLAITVIYVGYDRNQVWYYVLVALVLLPIGLALKKYDTLPLILTALFFDNIVSVLYRTWLIYS